MGKMKCIKCNADIEQDAQFCPYCGTKVVYTRCCTKCGKPLDEDSDFCPYCGTKQDSVNTESEQIEEVVQPQTTISVQELETVDPSKNQIEELPQEVKGNGKVDDVVTSNPEHSEPDSELPHESKNSSKKWLLIVGVILLLGILGGGGYYFMTNKDGGSSYIVETDSIAEIGDAISSDAQSVEGAKQRLGEILTKALKMQDDDAIHTYFSKEYRELYKKVNDYDNKYVDGPGFWNGNIWDGGQDGNPTDFTIIKVSSSSNIKAYAEVKLLHQVEEYHSENIVLMDLVFEDENWFIDDVNPKKGQMQEYIKSFEEYAKSEFELNDLMNIQELGDVTHANNIFKLKGYTLKGDSWVKGKMTINFDGKVLRIEAISDDGGNPFPIGWGSEFEKLMKQGYQSEDSGVGMVSRTDYIKQGKPIISIGSTMDHFVLSIGQQADM